MSLEATISTGSPHSAITLAITTPSAVSTSNCPVPTVIGTNGQILPQRLQKGQLNLHRVLA